MAACKHPVTVKDRDAPTAASRRTAKPHPLSPDGREHIQHVRQQCLSPEVLSRLMTLESLDEYRAFIRRKETITEALIRFLGGAGTWCSAFEDASNGFRETPFRHAIRVIYPEAVWKHQHKIKDALGRSPSEWLARGANDREFKLTTRVEYPYFVHATEYCLDAIRGSITFDFLRGAKFGICKREDCGTPFEMSHKGKVYCSQYCGHLVSLRKKRAGEKLTKRRKS